MRQTRIAAGVALVLLAAAPRAAAAAAPRDETPMQTIARLKQEAAQLRMHLKHAKMQAEQAKASQADAATRTKVAEVERNTLKKEIAALKNNIATVTVQNIQLQKLLDADSVQAPDAKVREVLTQLVQSLKDNTKLKALNTEIAEKSKAIEDRFEQMAKALLATRRELAMKTTALSDMRQELAIEKGKRIAPAAGLLRTTPRRTTGGAADPPRAGERTITAKVRAVSGDLASIDVGTEAGVTSGMKLLISRGEDYVATLVISQVEKRQAAGELVDVKVTPRSGDAVGNMP